MLFVFLAHFQWIYFVQDDPRARAFSSVLGPITMVAGPTFMIISGLMLGFLNQTRKNDFEIIRDKLIDRGLFLLTIGHVLITIAHVPVAGSLLKALRWGYITDAIGFSFILGSILIGKMQLRGRLFLSGVIYLISWFGVLFWHPGNGFLLFLKETFFGSSYKVVYTYNFPLFPWFSLYFSGSCLGQVVANYYLNRKESMINSLIRTAGLVAVSISIFIIFVRHLIFNLGFIPFNQMIMFLTSPYQKLPPSPVYFLFFGGVGLILVYVLFRYEKASLLTRFIDLVDLLGRTSLFVFILQYFVFYTALRLMNLPFTKFWPFYFLASIVIMSGLSHIWNKTNCNRFLTVQYPNLVKVLSGLGRKNLS